MKKKDIVMYFASYLLLAFSFVMFVFAFAYTTRKSFYVCSGLSLAAFCLMNRLTEKKIKCADGYNLLQAYFFYRKCEKKGIDIRTSKLKETDAEIISDIASGYDYCKDFDEAQLKELYKIGREVKTVLEQK